MSKSGWGRSTLLKMDEVSNGEALMRATELWEAGELAYLGYFTHIDGSQAHSEN